MHDPSTAAPDDVVPLSIRMGPPAPRRVWLAYLSGAFGLAATAQINFLVPLRARELGASFDVIGLIVGIGAAAPSLLAVTSGAAIDRLDSRRSFVIGTAATAILACVFPLATSYWWFLVLQPLLGIARNLGWLASQTYITGLGTAQERHSIAGRFAFFTNTGQMAAPALIGGAAQLIGVRWAFLFLAVYAAAFTGIGLLLAQPGKGGAPADRSSVGTGFRSAWQLLAIPAMQVVLLLSGVRLWITWIYTAFAPAYLVDHGLQPVTVGTVLATYGIVATLVVPSTGWWTRWASGPSVATAGLGCGIAALLIAPHFVTVPLVYVAPALIGLGHGVSLPVLLTIVAGAAPPGKRGVALGLRGAVNQATAAAGPILVGAVISTAGVLSGFAAGAAVSAAMLVAARVLQRGVGTQPRS